MMTQRKMAFFIFCHVFEFFGTKGENCKKSRILMTLTLFFFQTNLKDYKTTNWNHIFLKHLTSQLQSVLKFDLLWGTLLSHHHSDYHSPIIHQSFIPQVTIIPFEWFTKFYINWLLALLLQCIHWRCFLSGLPTCQSWLPHSPSCDSDTNLSKNWPCSAWCCGCVRW